MLETAQKLKPESNFKWPLPKDILKRAMEMFGGAKEVLSADINLSNGEQVSFNDILKFKWGKKEDPFATKKSEVNLTASNGIDEVKLALKITTEQLVGRAIPIGLDQTRERVKHFIDFDLPADLKEKYLINFGGPWVLDSGLSSKGSSMLKSRDLSAKAKEKGLSESDYYWDKSERRFVKKSGTDKAESVRQELHISNFSRVNSLSQERTPESFTVVGDDTSSSYLWLEFHPKMGEGKILTVAIWATEGLIRCEAVDREDLTEFRFRNSLQESSFTGMRVNPGE